MWGLSALAAVVVLAACEETGAKPTTTVQASDSADQVLEGFSHYVTRDGIRRSRVEADTAFFYESTQVTELRNVRVVFFDVQGDGGLYPHREARHVPLAGRLDGGERQRARRLARRPAAHGPRRSSTTTPRTRSRPTCTSPSTGAASIWRATASARTRTSRTSSPTGHAVWPGDGMLLPGQEP